MRATTTLATLLVLATTATGCSLAGSTAEAQGREVVLLTHDSFALSEGTLATFTEQSGITVTQRSAGDAGSLTNQLVLTADAPTADVVFGIDSTFASRAVEADVLTDYVSPAAADGAAEYAIDGSDALTAIDYGDVCVNVDTRYFAENDLAEPETLDDLTDPAYAGLTVVQDPATSSPGLAFLLATVAEKGVDGWADYWAALAANDVSVAASWEQAYTVDFSGSSGDGPRPIVVSYASSPPAEIAAAGEAPPTRALLDTCYRQVEYAGVVAGTSDTDAAEALIDFLLSETVQADVPENMYVYPVTEGTPLPASWEAHAPVPAEPLTLDPADIADHREAWIDTWRETVLG